MLKNEEKRTLILTTIICLIPILVGAILYPDLPDTVAIHWNAAGEANGWQSKFIGIIVFPAIFLLINLLVPVILRTDPKHSNIDKKVKGLIYWILPVVSVFCSGVTLSSAIGKELPIARIAPMLVGVLLIAIGNYLPKTTQNYYIGIKLPWTLESEENWNKTHRLGGFIFVIGGLAILISGILGGQAFIFVIIVAVTVIVPTVYSYMLSLKE